MASFSLSNTFRVEDILQALSPIKPMSTPDTFALAAIAIGYATYLLKGIAWDKPDAHYYKFFERPHLSKSSANNEKRETRNIAQKLKENGKKLIIFWGSQSGTAEGFANRLGRECHLRFGLEVLVADLSDYDAETIAAITEEELAIFIISTYGEGDPSDNTTGLWNWLQKSKDISLLNLRYVALGLGNSNYKYYNRVIDMIAESLDNSGAKVLMPVGKADDAQGTTEEDFISWKEDLFAMFRHRLGFQEQETRYTPTFSVIKDDSLVPIDLHYGEPSRTRDKVKTVASCSPIRALAVKNSKELLGSSERNCLHLDLDITDNSDLHYKTGDHLGVWPINPNEEIERLLEALGCSKERDEPITIRSLDPDIKVKIPTPTTTIALLRHYLEICAPVSRESILNLRQFAPSPEAKIYLTTLGEDKLAYTDFVSRNYLTIGRILSLASPKAPWTDLPLSYLIETLPNLQPRYYSISSSSVVSPRRPSITVLVSKTPLPNDATQNVLGLTTNYLLALSNSLNNTNRQAQELTYSLTGPSDVLQGGKIFANIRKSKFKLPTLSSCPLIMVSAGTGLAPFLAFLSERKKLVDIGRPVGEMLLFFGCRNLDDDFIYRAELEQFERDFGEKLKIVTAFSREGREKVYVQHKVSEYGEKLLRLLEKGANFYICGRAGMAKEVERTVGEVMKANEGWDDIQLGEWSRSMKGTRKWQEDVWG
ncbi:putative NADPH-cytochrome P450 reductase [Hyaloscypha variabilis F]|uniref:NADPH--cytochrome P450 reductase n=1 Tax=Hyaloscypha variabilis (strain UAMH 11265 / GT02V1 / F) TaxID=1149755 RepID=A0A2J6RG57_HYAVF|nr:putative NADPH-cytochrome P450 reductase [Hyaloscypha variabilis F]